MEGHVHSTIHGTVQYIIQYMIGVGTSDTIWTIGHGRTSNNTWTHNWCHRMGDVRRMSGALESRDTVFTQDSVIGGTDTQDEQKHSPGGVLDSHGTGYGPSIKFMMEF